VLLPIILVCATDEKDEMTIKNGQSRDAGNIGHRTQFEYNGSSSEVYYQHFAKIDNIPILLAITQKQQDKNKCNTKQIKTTTTNKNSHKNCSETMCSERVRISCYINATCGEVVTSKIST
jgi:hypothetical protein